MEGKIKSVICSVLYSPIGNIVTKYTGVAKIWATWRVKSYKKRLLADAVNQFAKGATLGSLEDYKEALEQHWVSYQEYANQYEFYNKAEAERDEFVSRLRMAYFYWRYAPNDAKAVFHFKTNFLKVFNKYVHRQWRYIPDTSFEEFKRIVSSYDCIIKPSDGKLGRGISKTYKDDKVERELYDECVKRRAIVEECIRSCDELSAFHPESLNTVRVVTISNKERAEVFGSFLRTGVGNSIVDNAHAGGIFAQINVESGIIESDGINTSGDIFKMHPDTKRVFLGTKIPYWETIVRTCCEAAKLTNNPITGWDVAINREGEIEFVEGNYGPDFDVMQSPLKVGVKKRIFYLIKDYLGISL